MAKLAQQTERYEEMINYADILFMSEGEFVDVRPYIPNKKDKEFDEVTIKLLDEL